MLRKSLVIDAKDNVAVLLEDAEAGDTILTPAGEIALLNDIPFPHKASLYDFSAGEPVYKYGEEIGYALCGIRRGEWIHDHNMGCRRGKEDVHR